MMEQSGYKIPRWAKVFISCCFIAAFLLALILVFLLSKLPDASDKKVGNKQELAMKLKSQAEFCTRVMQGDSKCLRFAFGYPQVVEGIVPCSAEQYHTCYPYLCEVPDAEEPLTKREGEEAWKRNCGGRLPTADEMPDWAEYYFFGRMP